VSVYFAGLAFRLGDPFVTADPLPPTEWDWNCDVPFFEKKNGQNVIREELKFFRGVYLDHVDQTMTHGQMGSCKVDNRQDDRQILLPDGNRDGFQGRCEGVGKRKYVGGKTDAVTTPSENFFHLCDESGPKLDEWRQDARKNDDHYGTSFGIKYDSKGFTVEPPEICQIKCPSMPTKAQIHALFPEVAALEAREKQEEKERLQRIQDEKNRQELLEQRERERIEEEARREREQKERQEKKEREREEAKKLLEEQERNRQARYKKFTVRFDDEDDGYWKTVSKAEGIKRQKQRPRSPVAMVGRAVWRYRKLHGIFEVIVTFFLTPVCIFISRYFKETWLGWRVLNQPAWLMGHLWLSWVALFFHVFGIHSGVLGVSYMGSSMRSQAMIHRYLGFATLLLFFLINILGAFRPINVFARRCCIGLHWIFGLLAYALNCKHYVTVI